MTMQIIKPMRLGIINKTYGFEGNNFTVAALSFFKLGGDNELLTDNTQWPRLATALPAGTMLDMGFAKTNGEILAVGNAYTSGKQPKTTVAISLAAVKKQLQVIGDRTWDGGFFSSASDAEPFTSMPLDYARTYGGVGYPENPQGKGVINPKQQDPDTGLYHLANIYANNESTSADKSPRSAASFAPLDITWPQRSRYQGTYDQAWADNVHPAFPHNTNTKLFNAGAADQQIDGFFQPGDSYEIKGMHPELPLIKGQLPDVRARVFIAQLIDGQEQFSELETVIDTVWFLPELELGVAIHRGVAKVADSDGLEVKKMLMALEGASDVPRPIDYFEKVMSLRLDPTTGAAHLLNESQLMPQKTAAQVIEVEALYAQAKAEQQQKIQQYNQARIAALKADNPELADIELPEFVDDEDFPPMPQALIDAGDIDLAPYLENAQKRIDQAQAELTLEMAKQQQAVNALIAEQGEQPEAVESFDSMQARVKQVIYVLATDLPDPGEADQLEWIGKLPPMAIDVEKINQIRQANQQLLVNRRQSRQQSPVNTVFDLPLPEHGAAQLRSWAIALLDSGVSLAGRDLAGADLSGMDFSGQDLRDIMLERADLSGCNFTDCRLEGAVMTEATLHYAVFVNSNLTQANLAHCRCKKARFNQANLTAALVNNAEFISCDLTGATLNKVQGIEVDFNHSTLQHVQCESCQFIQCNFEYSDCQHGNISNSIFIEAQLSHANWQQVNLSRLMMLKTTAKGCNFCGTTADTVQFSNEGDFSGADLSAGSWKTCGFRGLNLSDCDTRASAFKECDFGETNLTGGKLSDALFDQCTMALAVFDHSDCQQALFNQSKLRKSQFNEVDLRHSQMYQTDVSAVKFERCQQ